MADRVLLTRLGALSNVGLYTVGYGLAAGLQIIVTAGNNAIMPEFSRASDEDKSFQRLPGITTYYLLLCGFATVGFAAFMPVFVTYLFSTEYAAVTSILPWLALAFFANALYYPPVNVLTQTGRETRSIPIITITAGLLNIGVNFLLIPPYGIVGAAVSTLLAYLSLAALIYLFSRTIVTVQYEYRRVVIVFIATAVGVGTTIITPVGRLVVEIAGGVLQIAVFAIVLTVLGFWSHREVSFVRSQF